jgi:hypothetical protein
MAQRQPENDRSWNGFSQVACAEQHRDDAEIFVPIGSNGFFIEGSEKARFDQQPVEACATVSACLEVYRLTEEGSVV